MPQPPTVSVLGAIERQLLEFLSATTAAKGGPLAALYVRHFDSSQALGEMIAKIQGRSIGGVLSMGGEGAFGGEKPSGTVQRPLGLYQYRFAAYHATDASNDHRREPLYRAADLVVASLADRMFPADSFPPGWALDPVTLQDCAVIDEAAYCAVVWRFTVRARPATKGL